MALCRRRPLLLALLAPCLGAASAAAPAPPPQLGPWPVAEASYNVSALDGSDPAVWLVYPACNATACPRFPLITYLHGMAGGNVALLGYSAHFYRLASWGFVVAAPVSCALGCTDASGGAPWTDCAGLPDVQPALWPAFYGESLKIIEWARNMTATKGGPIFASIDWSAGVGVAGHSMGAQAAAIAASPACAKAHDIRAVALHHNANGNVTGGAGGNVGANISVPLAAFTSSGDAIWHETVELVGAFNASARARALPFALRDVTGYSHLEPLLAPPVENPRLATFTAAWFKVMLNGDRGEFWDAIFGAGAGSLCASENMTECYTRNAP